MPTVEKLTTEVSLADLLAGPNVVEDELFASITPQSTSSVSVIPIVKKDKGNKEQTPKRRDEIVVAAGGSDDDDDDDDDKEDDDVMDDDDEKNKEVEITGPSRREKRKAQEERDARTIFVGNVHVDLTSASGTRRLRALFAVHGTIEALRFRSFARADGAPRKLAFIRRAFHPLRDTVNCYVVFSEVEAAQRAAKAENGRVVLGKHLRVDIAGGTERKTYDHRHSVFLGNLPFDVADEDVHGLFAAHCGTESVVGVRVVRDKTSNIGKGFGYATFTTLEAVELALSLHDTELAGRKIRVTRSKKTLAQRSALTPGTKKISAQTSNTNQSTQGSITTKHRREGTRAAPGDVVALQRRQPARRKR